MKYNACKLLALVTVLAMLLSFVAVAEDSLTELGMDQPIEIEGEVGTDGDTQAPEGEVEIDMDEAEGLPDGEIDPEGGEDLPIDLDGEALEMGEEELAPVTEEAMNEGDEQDGTEDKPVPITSWVELYGHMSQGPTESEDKKTHYRLENDVSPLNNQQK